MVILSGLISKGTVLVHHTVMVVEPKGYLIGGIIALLVMGYLVYSLIRPEKF